jgi:acyl-CoA oxidase
LLPRLAKGYGIIFGGLAIKQLAEDNFERIKRKDFSTFNETHAILS